MRHRTVPIGRRLSNVSDIAFRERYSSHRFHTSATLKVAVRTSMRTCWNSISTVGERALQVRSIFSLHVRPLHRRRQRLILLRRSRGRCLWVKLCHLHLSDCQERSSRREAEDQPRVQRSNAISLLRVAISYNGLPYGRVCIINNSTSPRMKGSNGE